MQARISPLPEQLKLALESVLAEQLALVVGDFALEVAVPESGQQPAYLLLSCHYPLLDLLELLLEK